MSRLHSDLEKLGSSTKYAYDKPTADILETFPNPSAADYEVNLEFKEFTSLCPKTGQPDFANIEIRYLPKEKCVETKSLKLYLFAYRNHGSFMEEIVTTMRDHLVETLEPKALRVVGRFAARGGITLNVEASHRDGQDSQCSRGCQTPADA